MNHIQYISDEQDNVTAVIVPIELWKEIESEKKLKKSEYWLVGIIIKYDVPGMILKVSP